MKETTKITINRKAWFLFSVENNYDQPPNNMVCWWSEKPKLEEVAKAIGQAFPNGSDEGILAVVRVWSGDVVRHMGSNYRLREVSEACMPMTGDDGPGAF